MYYTLFTVLALAASNAVAFSSRMFGLSMTEHEKGALEAISSQIETASLKPPILSPGFSASSQYASNQDAHKYVAPRPNDLRGQCPVLNAMANHNYLHTTVLRLSPSLYKGSMMCLGWGRILRLLLLSMVLFLRVILQVRVYVFLFVFELNLSRSVEP